MYSIPDILIANDRYLWAKIRRNYDFEKRRYATRCFPFGIFYAIAIARDRIFVRNSYSSPCLDRHNKEWEKEQRLTDSESG